MFLLWKPLPPNLGGKVMLSHPFWPPCKWFCRTVTISRCWHAAASAHGKREWPITESFISFIVMKHLWWKHKWNPHMHKLVKSNVFSSTVTLQGVLELNENLSVFAHGQTSTALSLSHWREWRNVNSLIVQCVRRPHSHFFFQCS